MLAAFSIVYWVFFAAMLPVFWVVAAVLWLVTWPIDRRRVVLHLYSCFWASFYIWVNPLWRVRFAGRDHLPWRGPAVIVANHLSLLDVLVLYGLFRPFKWVSKAEVFKVPFIGWNMRMNDHVAVLRGNPESVREMMDHCRAHLARGTPILIFPEGTRSRDCRLQRFKDGAFKLAAEAGVPVIPLAVVGTGDALPKHGLVLREQMRGQVTVLDPIPPSKDADALREAARAAIIAALPEHNRPALPPLTGSA